jgi:hypothetical protein
MKAAADTTTTDRDFWGPAIHTYTRAQAIADGVLVDVTDSDEWREAGIRYPVCLTNGAFEATISAGGEWIDDGTGSGEQTLRLSGGQSFAGRLWDVLYLFKLACKAAKPGGDCVWFAVRVDKLGNGKTEAVKLWARVGPGDTAAPVVTIMLTTED